jgi:hypothetical protein
VPVEVRAASARALALAAPPTELVALLAADDHAVAAPVLRTAILPASDWLSLLPRLDPQARAVLRHRRDLPAEVGRGLESFGATDFVLGHDAPQPEAPVQPEVLAEPEPMRPVAPLDATSFVAVGEAARGLPVVAEALKQAGDPRRASRSRTWSRASTPISVPGLYRQSRRQRPTCRPSTSAT